MWQRLLARRARVRGTRRSPCGDARRSEAPWLCSRRATCTSASATRWCCEDIEPRASRRARLSGIMGPNGAGKTTCFNVLTGRYAPDRGQRHASPATTSPACRRAAIARQGISRSFQIMNLFDDYSALDNVAGRAAASSRARGFDAVARPGADARRAARRAAVLARVGLAGKEHVPAQEPLLRRAARARDRRGARRRAAAAVPRRADRRPRPEGTRAARRADRASCKRALTIVDDRARHALPVRPRRPDLGDPLGPGDRRGHAGRAARQSVGAALEPRERAHDARALDAHRDASTARRRRCSASRSTVAAGEVVALLGPNGAGKTTTLRSILGLTPRARAAAIRFDGRDITRGADARDRARAASAGCPTTGASSRRSRWRATSSIARKTTRFRAWTLEGVLRDLLARSSTCCTASARTCPAARCRWWRSRARCSARRAWCCSTSRARASRRRSCRT